MLISTFIATFVSKFMLTCSISDKFNLNMGKFFPASTNFERAGSNIAITKKLRMCSERQGF